MSVAYFESPVGLLRLESSGQELRHLSPTVRREPEAQDALLREAIAQLRAYFSGALQRFSLPLDPQGTAFQRKVWTALSQVPYGKVVTYGQLAQTINQPGACRAVANAVGRNPLMILLPCHRVVASNGLGGFTGGLAIKRALLSLEQVEIRESARFSEKYFFTFS